MVRIERMIAKLTADLRARIAALAARGLVKLVASGGKMQRLQVGLLDGEVRDDAEHFEPYGFTARPFAGAECFVVFPMGARDHPVVLCVADRRYRLSGLAEGECALYDDQGQTIVLRRDRIEVTAPKVVVLSDDVQLGAEGGPAVARVGDSVDLMTGLITSGSAKVRAV